MRHDQPSAGGHSGGSSQARDNKAITAEQAVVVGLQGQRCTVANQIKATDSRIALGGCDAL